MRIGVLLACVGLLLAGCQREKRDIRPSPARLAIYGDAAKEGTLQPGGPINPQPVVRNPYTGSGYDISEGRIATILILFVLIIASVGTGKATSELSMRIWPYGSWPNLQASSTLGCSRNCNRR